MTKHEAIKNAADTVVAHGYSLPDSLKKMIADIENPQYRVAVVGKFKVGKSTLINHVFMGDKPLLSEGGSFTAETAVATDVESGSVSRLECYEWKENGGEQLVSSKDDPTVEDIRAVTAGSSEAARTELARKVSRVKLITPNESLQGYTVVDTPGLDDPNKDLLLNTTYRVIPGSDVALLVVEPKMLDQIEDDLLRKNLIDKGVSRVMVLVSYKHGESDCRSSQKRSDVVETIKAQLAKIGRSDIPVEMYCFDSSIGDIISDASELRLAIRTFLNNNALPGRLERVAYEVRQYLEDVELEVAAKIKALVTSEAEKAALQKKVEDQIAEFKAQCEKSFRRLQSEMQELKEDASQRSSIAVRRVFSAFVEKLELAPDVNAIRKLVDNAEVSVRNDLTDRIATLGREIKIEIEAIIDRYAQDLTDVMNAWNKILLDDFKIDRPFVAKIPPILFDAIMALVWDIFLPGGPLLGVFAQIIAKKFGLDPTIIVVSLLRSQAKAKIAEAQEQAEKQIPEQIGKNVDSAFLKIKESLETYNKGQVEKMRKMVVCEEVSSDRAELEKTKTDIAAAIQSLR